MTHSIVIAGLALTSCYARTSDVSAFDDVEPAMREAIDAFRTVSSTTWCYFIDGEARTP